MEQDMSVLTRLVKETIGSAEFKPCAFYDQVLDTFTVLEKDCSIIEEGDPSNSNITILKDMHTMEIVGVRISQWSRWEKIL